MSDKISDKLIENAPVFDENGAWDQGLTLDRPEGPVSAEEQARLNKAYHAEDDPHVQVQESSLSALVDDLRTARAERDAALKKAAHREGLLGGHQDNIAGLKVEIRRLNVYLIAVSTVLLVVTGTLAYVTW